MRSSFGPEPSFFKSIAVVVVVSQKKSASRSLHHHPSPRSIIRRLPSPSRVVLHRPLARVRDGGDDGRDDRSRAHRPSFARARTSHRSRHRRHTLRRDERLRRRLDGRPRSAPPSVEGVAQRRWVFFSHSWGDTAWSMYVWRWRLTWCVWDVRTVRSVIFFCVSICPSA